MIRVPVYSDENQLHHVSIFEEDTDGTFKRTQSEPLRMLRDNIEGISNVQGDLISHHFDKNDRKWMTPTVSFHYGKPQSFYRFIREKIAVNKFYVFTKPNLSGRIIKFELHELRLKPSTSQRILKLLKEKYLEAVDLWTEEQLQNRTRKLTAAGVGVQAKHKQLTTEQSTKRRALEKMQENRKRMKAIKQKASSLLQYNNLSLMPKGVSAQEHSMPHATDLSEKTVLYTPKNRRRKAKIKDEESHFYQRFVIDVD